MLEVQTVRVDPDERRVWSGTDEVRLSRKEFDLLHLLIRNAGRVVSRDELMQQVWHTTFWTSSKTIDVHLGWLRRKIGDDARRPHLITTIRGRGLRFEVTAPARTDAAPDGRATRRTAEAQPAGSSVTVTDQVAQVSQDVTGQRHHAAPGDGPGATGPGPQASTLVAARPQPAL